MTQALHQQLMQELNKALQGNWQYNNSIIAPAMPNASISAMLKRIQSGEFQSTSNASFTVFFESKLEFSWPKHWHDWLKTASPWQDWATDDTPPIIIEIGSQYDSFCSRQCASITHVYLNANESLDHAFAHEITHGLSWSGNRFLDEGLALWCEKKLCHSLRNTTHTTLPTAQSIHSYRDLFFRHGNAGKYLTSHDNDNATYASALACVEHILQEIPIANIQAIFNQLATLPGLTEQWYTLISISGGWCEQSPKKAINSTELRALICPCRASLNLSAEFEQALHHMQLSVHQRLSVHQQLSNQQKANNQHLNKTTNDPLLEINQQRIALLVLLTLKAKIFASINKPVDWALIKSIQHHLNALGEHSDPRLSLIRVKYYLALLIWRIGDHLSQTEKELSKNIALALKYPPDQDETLMEQAAIEFYYFKQGTLPQQQCIATLSKIPPKSDFYQEARNFAHYQKLAL